MNRPTNDVDNLLALANEALAAADTTQAVEILRKAAGIAPLRKDIRNRLAYALEQQPSTVATMVADDEQYYDNYELYADSPADEPANGKETIGQIARRAFEAASSQTTRASTATRRLSDLLHQGLESWKSVRVDKGSSANVDSEPIAEGGASSAQDKVFAPNAELQSYLDRGIAPDVDSGYIDGDDADEVLPMIESSRLGRTSNISSKSAKSKSSKKKSKPKDVEDVLVAGIDGFIEVAGQINKKKVLYGVVYLAMAGLFGFACFDVSRKFPANDAMPSAATISVGSIGEVSQTINTDQAQLDLNATSSGTPEVAKWPEIDSLRQQLESARLVEDRDAVRVKLITLLNNKGDAELKANQFDSSIKTYQEAAKLAPNDANLKVRLANALYFQATVNPAAQSGRAAFLADAANILKSITKNENADVIALHLLALVQDAQGNHEDAKSIWKKVKSVAQEGSAISLEAESRLK